MATPAQIKLNRERTLKAVERLNQKVSYAGIHRYVAEFNEGQPGIIVEQTRPYNSALDVPFQEFTRYITEFDQTIGYPITYSNKYSSNNRGTMCRGIYVAEQNKRNKLEGIRRREQEIAQMKIELEKAEAALAAYRAGV